MFSSPVSLFRAPATTTVSAGPWYMMAWSGSMRPVMSKLSACDTFSRMKLGRSAVLLVSPGWAPTAYSCISTLRCRATVTAVSSERLCVYHTRCLNLRNSHNRVLISLLSLMCRRTTSRLFVHPHSFTRVDTSKRSSPRHCALQVCSVARNFTHQASIHVI